MKKSALNLGHLVGGILLLTSLSATAGINDFNTIIEENMQAQQQLREELKKQVQAVDSKQLKEEMKNKNFAETGRAVLGEQKAENVAVNSKKDITKSGKSARKSLDLEKRNLKRISEEIKQAQ
jgi:hypothetical protein